jgi:hypothetical protein
MALFSRITSAGTTEFPLLDCGHYAVECEDLDTGFTWLECKRSCKDAAGGYTIDGEPLEDAGSRDYPDGGETNGHLRGCRGPRCYC